MPDVQDCECCGVTTRGRVCRRCQKNAECAKDALRESLKHALEYDRQRDTNE